MPYMYSSLKYQVLWKFVQQILSVHSFLLLWVHIMTKTQRQTFLTRFLDSGASKRIFLLETQHQDFYDNYILCLNAVYYARK